MEQKKKMRMMEREGGKSEPPPNVTEERDQVGDRERRGTQIHLNAERERERDTGT